MLLFYEKPGCINNTKQKQLLTAAGCRFEARDLLTEAWSAEHLRRFFCQLPVAEWFNRSAPQVKSGAVVPEALDEAQALSLMLAEPLLIRRPLLERDGEYLVGFDPAAIAERFGIRLAEEPPAESCPRNDGHRCD